MRPGRPLRAGAAPSRPEPVSGPTVTGQPPAGGGAGAAPLLVVQGVQKRFGGVQALGDLSLAVAPGEVVGLIGPNGSGKSTSVNLIAGVFPPSAGSISLAGQDLRALGVDARVRLGLARTFQTTTLFAEISPSNEMFASNSSLNRSSSKSNESATNP